MSAVDWGDWMCLVNDDINFSTDRLVNNNNDDDTYSNFSRFFWVLSESPRKRLVFYLESDVKLKLINCKEFPLL